MRRRADIVVLLPLEAKVLEANALRRRRDSLFEAEPAVALAAQEAEDEALAIRLQEDLLKETEAGDVGIRRAFGAQDASNELVLVSES